MRTRVRHCIRSCLRERDLWAQRCCEKNCNARVAGASSNGLTLLATATTAITLDQLPSKFDARTFNTFAAPRPQLLAGRWGEFVQQTGPLQLEAARLFAAGRLRRDDPTYARATRECLARLGPTFIKLGQIISVREDILGPVWASELALLQDGIEPVPSEEALAAVAASFTCETIEASPVACASPRAGPPRRVA